MYVLHTYSVRVNEKYGRAGETVPYGIIGRRRMAFRKIGFQLAPTDTRMWASGRAGGSVASVGHTRKQKNQRHKKIYMFIKKYRTRSITWDLRMRTLCCKNHRRPLVVHKTKSRTARIFPLFLHRDPPACTYFPHISLFQSISWIMWVVNNI